MASRFGDISLTRYDDLFRTEEERQADQQERIITVSANQIFPYTRHRCTTLCKTAAHQGACQSAAFHRGWAVLSWIWKIFTLSACSASASGICSS